MTIVNNNKVLKNELSFIANDKRLINAVIEAYTNNNLFALTNTVKEYMKSNTVISNRSVRTDNNVIFTLRKSGFTLQQISDYLTDHGVPTPTWSVRSTWSGNLVFRFLNHSTTTTPRTAVTNPTKYIASLRNKGYTFKSIADHLNSERVSTPEWSRKNVWSQQIVYRTLEKVGQVNNVAA